MLSRHIRRVLVLVVGVLVLRSSVTVVHAQAHFLRGDANHDTAVDISDPIFTLSALFQDGPFPPCADAADFNDDGAVDISDAIAGLQFLHLGGDPPDAPFPVFEGDPSADDLDCLGPPVEVSGVIRSNLRLTRDRCWKLNSIVFVQEGARLTIEAGTTVLGDSWTQGGLVVERGARIVAVGTRTHPVVFTSDKPVGERDVGDWAGIWILGHGDNNVSGKVAFTEGLDNELWGGGDNVRPADDSGHLSYVRIEYTGVEMPVEPAALGLFAVGSGTRIDHIQVKRGQDDGIDIRGGSVDLRYVLASYIVDDSFEYNFGWTGRGQFWLCHQDAWNADRGFEVENSESDFNALPRTSPTISNVTLIGDPDRSRGDESDTGLLIRRGVGGWLRNFIVTGFGDAGFDLDDFRNDSTCSNWIEGRIRVEHSIFHRNGDETQENHCDVEDDCGDMVCLSEDAALRLISDDPSNLRNNLAVDAAERLLLVRPFDHENPDFRPRDAALVNWVDPSSDDPWFEPIDFAGGVDPNDDWTREPWISYAKR